MQSSFNNQSFEKTTEYLRSLTEVHVGDGEWKRRGRTLSTLLLAFLTLSIIGFLANLGYSATEARIFWLTFIICAITAVCSIILYFINKYYSVKVAASTFILVLIVLLFVADDPIQTVWGRNMIPLAIPIVMAGLILNPNFSFLIAIIVSLGSSILALATDQKPNAYGIISYLALATISWLTTRNLEGAVAKLNTSNKELDERVSQRTKELSHANYLLEEERRHLERRVIQRTTEISEMNTHLIQVSRIKDEFLASMSHELRTPLNAIIGYSEGIIEESEDFEHVEEIFIDDVEKILASGRHLLNIINDILDISKLEANQNTVNLNRINIKEFFERLLITIGPVIEKQDNTLVLENNCDDVVFVSDEFKLSQIVINLLSNAAKFTFNGTIKLLAEDSGNGKITFSVSDNGVGIPPEAQHQIFLPFRQAENGQSRTFDGSGLGLAISSKLATILGGSLSVQSEVGEGSTFSLMLPTDIRPSQKMIERELNKSGKKLATN